MNLRDDNPNQNRAELIQFVQYAQALNVRQYLEIGSRDGDSLYAVVANMERNCFAVSIDIEARPGLWQTRQELSDMGHRCVIIPRSSHDRMAQQMIGAAAPYDLILIDGDHSYEGVRADWQAYGKMGKSVAFHDIANFENPGVIKLWHEIVTDRSAHCTEIVVSGSNMGFGIVQVIQ